MIDNSERKDDLLKLAGKLANAAELLLNSDVKNMGDKLNLLRQRLDDYNNAIMDGIKL